MYCVSLYSSVLWIIVDSRKISLVLNLTIKIFQNFREAQLNEKTNLNDANMFYKEVFRTVAKNEIIHVCRCCFISSVHDENKCDGIGRD